MTESSQELHYFIINTESGTARILDMNQFEVFLKKKLKHHKINGRIRFCSAAAIEDAIRSAILEKPAAITVGGGDGTISSSAGLLQNTGIALGILPMGTFNLAARDHGINPDPEKAIEQLCQARINTVPLLRINTYPCLCTATIGFYPRLMKLMNQIRHTRWWFKSLQIVWNSVIYFTRCPAYRFSVSINGNIKQYKSRIMIIIPGSYQDTIGLIPQRDTRFPDSISFYIFRHLGRSAILRSIIYFISGRINKNPDVKIVNADTATINFKNKKQIKLMIDGEVLLLGNPLRTELKHDSLKLLLPTEGGAA